MIVHTTVLKPGVKALPILIRIKLPEDYRIHRRPGTLKRKFRESPQARESAFVHVFDWSGNLVAVPGLDFPATAIVVDEESAHLYLAGTNPTPSLRVARMPEVLSFTRAPRGRLRQVRSHGHGANEA